VANLVMAQLLHLESEDPEKDIQLYINSPGGSVTALLAIYDTMQYVKPDVATTCMGQAASAAAVLLAAGAPGKRPRPARTRDPDPPAVRRGRGPVGRHRDPGPRDHPHAPDADEILATHTGQEVEKIGRDTDRDFIMTASQAKEYGIIDEIIESRQAAEELLAVASASRLQKMVAAVPAGRYAPTVDDRSPEREDSTRWPSSETAATC
jgi:ATP-dependent Clp protease protease subunit